MSTQLRSKYSLFSLPLSESKSLFVKIVRTAIGFDNWQQATHLVKTIPCRDETKFVKVKRGEATEAWGRREKTASLRGFRTAGRTSRGWDND